MVNEKLCNYIGKWYQKAKIHLLEAMIILYQGQSRWFCFTFQLVLSGLLSRILRKTLTGIIVSDFQEDHKRLFLQLLLLFTLISLDTCSVLKQFCCIHFIFQSSERIIWNFCLLVLEVIAFFLLYFCNVCRNNHYNNTFCLFTNDI